MILFCYIPPVAMSTWLHRYHLEMDIEDGTLTFWINKPVSIVDKSKIKVAIGTYATGSALSTLSF